MTTQQIFKAAGYLGILGLGLVSLPSFASDVPAFSATYAVNVDGKKGTATRTLTKNGNQYKYTVNGSAAKIATLNQESHFSLNQGQIIPNRASMSARVFGIGNTHDVRFYPGSKTIVSSYKGKSKTLTSQKQAYDDLSMEIQIRQELINGKFSGSYPLVKRNEIEITKFKKIATTTLTTPAGTYQVVRIDRQHHDQDRFTSFWLAPSLNYLPIKVSQTADGRVISMELTKIN